MNDNGQMKLLNIDSKFVVKQCQLCGTPNTMLLRDNDKMKVFMRSKHYGTKPKD